MSDWQLIGILVAIGMIAIALSGLAAAAVEEDPRDKL